MESLLAGAMAGLVVDLTLYPIDTIKTRIQSKNGFYGSGGFKQIYKGLSAVAIGSVPGGAAFFFTYDTVKTLVKNLYSEKIVIEERDENNRSINIASCTNINKTDHTQTKLFAHSLAAVCGETVACSIRVPVEMVKQRMQAGQYASVWTALCHITNDGAVSMGEKIYMPRRNIEILPATHICWKGVHHLFTGMPIMLLREWPFSVAQMCLYEELKVKVRRWGVTESEIYWSLPLCGAISGGCAAFVTTPVDVIKTRIMLQSKWYSSQRSDKHWMCQHIYGVIIDILREPCRVDDHFGTVQKFFRGATARVLWISLGGGVFFGTYELSKNLLESY